MNALLHLAIVFAAVDFVVVAATMNAMFAATLGRTALESGLYVAISIGADVAKAILPVVVVRGLVLRDWTQAGAAATLLVVVTGVSLMSGTGFAAMTRDAVTAGRTSVAQQQARTEADLREVEVAMARISAARPTAIVNADLDTVRLDRRWSASKSCGEANSKVLRQFCLEVLGLRAELMRATEYERLTEQRQALRVRLDTMLAAGSARESDPQVKALADLLGIQPARLRNLMTAAIAVVLELGAVILVLVAAGPTLRGWREPGNEPEVPAAPVELPLKPDRAYWRRQRERLTVATESRSGSHAP